MASLSNNPMLRVDRIHASYCMQSSDRLLASEACAGSSLVVFEFDGRGRPEDRIVIKLRRSLAE